jgi:hypothetical protein
MQKDETSTITYRGKQWTRRALGVFLNLVVLPGSGSLVLGRKTEGFIQIGGAVAGLALQLAAATTIAAKVGADIGSLRKDELDLGVDQVGDGLAGSLLSDPPTLLGVDATWVFLFGLTMLILSWIFSMISSLLPSQGEPWRWGHGTRPRDHLSSNSD